MSDKWVWDREKFAKRRADGMRDSYEIMVFDTFSRLSQLGTIPWIPREDVEVSTHYDGLQVLHRRTKNRGVDQIQTLLVTPEGEVLDFSCDPKDEEIPQFPRLTRERIEAILREKGKWPRRKRRRK